jgi:PAS domain S-box-containing protein
MADEQEEERRLRAVALQNAQAILAARQRAERELAAERERLRITLASIGDAVISTDADGRIAFLNAVAEGLTGWPQAEAAGRPLPDVFRIVHERTRQPVENPALRALKDGVVVGLANHTVLVARDGSERPIDDSAAPMRDEQGRPVGAVLVFRDVTERRRAEEAQARLAAIVESSNDAIVSKTLDGVIRTWNAGAERIFGYTAAEAVGKPITLVVPPERHDEERMILDRLRRGERIEHYQTVRVAKDGRRIDISLSISPIRDADGSIIAASKVGRDITAQKRAEAALRESEERLAAELDATRLAEEALRATERRLRQLADAMPQIVWTAGPDGQIDYLNRRWAEFTGQPNTVGNEAWGPLLHPEEARAAGERWAACVATGAPFEMELRLLDRRQQAYRWHLLRTVAVKDEAGRVARWYGTATDIHEQKRAEEASRYLAEASAALARVVDHESTLQKVANLAVPYFADWSAVDVFEDGRLRRLAVAHQDPEKVRFAHELMRDYPPDPDAPNSVFAVLRTGKPEVVAEITDDLLVRGARDERHLGLIRSLGLRSYICVPLIVTGNPFGALTFATAESGRRYTEADVALAIDLAHRAAVAIENTQLYEALRDQDRRKDEFLATLAHELRNPLAPIRNALQILKMPRVDAATAERSRNMMERQVHHLVRMVDDLLDVSRVMRGKIELRRERVELATVVARAVETVQPLVEAQGHELTVLLPVESLPLDADPVRLSQVIGNLLTNAAKYTEPGGCISLSAAADGDAAVLRVRDTGIGIAPAMLPRVFELFVQVDHASTRAQGGLGIGLTLVKNLVEMHNGTVDARSEGLGKGSEFVVRLPLAERGLEQAPGGKAAVQDPAPPWSGLRVLVADDNQDAADSLAILLRMRGHEVRVAYSGMAVLEITKTYTPDVVFLDIGMPALDGYEVARRLRQTPSLEKTVLVALTGWGQREDRRRTAEAGFDHHLVKPPEPAAVEGILAGLKGGDRH